MQTWEIVADTDFNISGIADTDTDADFNALEFDW